MKIRAYERGCPKLNLQLRSSNTDAIEFYRKLGYTRDEVVSFGRRLIPDAAAEHSVPAERKQETGR